MIYGLILFLLMENPFSGIVEKTEQKRRAQGDAIIPIAWKYAQNMSKQTGKSAVDYYKLLMETANQETHFGVMSKNIMQIDPIQVKELNKPKYKQLRDDLDITNYDINNPEGSLGFAAATYLSRLKNHDLSTTESRAQAWKELYNTKAGKGTSDKYLKTNSMMDWTKTDEWWKGKNG